MPELTDPTSASCAQGDPGDVFVNQLLEALGDGVDVDSYIAARALGADHSQLVEFHSAHPGDMAIYVNLLRWGGEHGLIMMVLGRVGVTALIEAVEAGLIPAELGSCAEDDCLGDYLRVRQFGEDHLDALEAVGARVPVGPYSRVRNAGVSHDAVIAAHLDGVDLDGYAACLRCGIAQDEIDEVHKRGFGLYGYQRRRQLGLKHDQALRHAVRFVTNHRVPSVRVSTSW